MNSIIDALAIPAIKAHYLMKTPFYSSLGIHTLAICRPSTKTPRIPRKHDA
jgi:hypothetical protein